MEQLTPDQLGEYLDTLLDRGVLKFSCPMFSVEIGPTFVAKSDDIDPEVAAALERRRAARIESPHGNYGHPSLWRGGKPPAFPTRGE